MFEYEYIPPNQEGGSHEYSTTLPSVYPADTPAGMRGEAVRAALRSTQCLAWTLAASSQASQDSPNLSSGLLQLEGKGVLDFLNNKLSNSFTVTSAPEDTHLLYKQACLLTPKGRLVDTLSLAFNQELAFVLPSPGHSSEALFQRLDPFIFPMDRVKLTDLSATKDGDGDGDGEANMLAFTLASTQLSHVDDTVTNQFLPKLRELLGSRSMIPTGARKEAILPSNRLQSRLVDLGDTSRLLVLPLTGLSECACVGYTFAFLGNADSQEVGNDLWRFLVGDDNAQGPVEIKGLEYETLRIEAGVPAFGYEVTGAWKKPTMTSPTPIELHQKAGVIDTEKGCYLGQEGIASVLKNARGPPRALYSVVFQDDDNIYQHQSDGDKSNFENLTKMPKPGDKLFVLGSNEEIEIGTLTSVAEPYGTGDNTIVALALVRRADSILNQMKAKDLQITRGLAASLASSPASFADVNAQGSGIIQPPPMDSLDGLEVIVGGSFTVGSLRGVAKRRYLNGKNMFVEQEREQSAETGEILEQEYVDIEYSGMSPTERMDELREELESTDEDENTADEDATPTSEAASSEDEGDDAEAESQRKAAKMEMLKQRADEAMARRKQFKQDAAANKVEEPPKGDDDEAAEAIRKAEKLQQLQQRAEEAIARRRKKKEQQD